MLSDFQATGQRTPSASTRGLIKRRESSNIQFVKRIPADVLAYAIGKTITLPLGPERVSLTITPHATAIRLSLRTASAVEAKARCRDIEAHLHLFWQSLRHTKPTSLTHRQATALAGDLYQYWVEVAERERINPDTAASRLRALMSSGGSQSFEQALNLIVGDLLRTRGIAAVDAETRPVLIKAAHMALMDALDALERNAAGDYSPDPKAARFPRWEPSADSVSDTRRAPITVTGLLEDWWQEAQASGRKPSTYDSYKTAVIALIGFLKHDDASRVAPEDLVRFKQHLLTTPRLSTGRPASAKTIKHSYLAGLKAVFGWAAANYKLPSNPVSGITLKLGKGPKLRSKSFSEAEAQAILKATLKPSPSKTLPQTAVAMRWVPWLCAYTGARVGEMCQLRKQDLKQKDGVWVIHITPEAGTVKTNEARDVPLHPHLIEQGFGEFVHKAKPGPLFVRSGKGGNLLGRVRGLKNRLAVFTRKIIKDPNVAPNHGWRHRFKTVGREAGIPPSILDAIQGHATRSVADAYGETTVKAMAAAIEKFPRIEVSG